MDLDQQLKHLSQKYSFTNASYKTDEQIPNLEVCLQLSEACIEKFILKASQLNSIIESCANMVCIFDPDARDTHMQTSLHCGKNNMLYIRTTPSMLKILIETLFD